MCISFASVIDSFLNLILLYGVNSNGGSMLTLSAKSETLVNDFTNLSIRNDINDGDYDSHKVREYVLIYANDGSNVACIYVLK